ncbi:hypothetical protein DFH08DRAFT_938718 [Mycena albidolilacea]|uniref:Uncharacterized protein n=1 Tax=Mycena albidolilacea TaxID=1033008 RepID=A0AAD6ZU97_9AGAR|nr:hypothetical protein DFH08DRAFT_938718 [Mycena albidolilacea]
MSHPSRNRTVAPSHSHPHMERRKAVDYGQPLLSYPETSDDPSYRRPRRAALDYGLPQKWDTPKYVPPVRFPPSPNGNARYMPQRKTQPLHITPVMRELPALPTLSRDAPSLWSQHPYALLMLNQLGSGNCPSPPPPANCAECRLDAYTEAIRQRYSNSPSLTPEDKRSMSKSGSLVIVDFNYVNSRAAGLYVTDILSFKADVVQPEYVLVRQGFTGPIKIKLFIEHVGEVEDILYANCAHRGITRLNLAWSLAFSFQRLVEKTFRRSAKDLVLLSLYSPDGVEWAASARYVPRSA